MIDILAIIASILLSAAAILVICYWDLLREDKRNKEAKASGALNFSISLQTHSVVIGKNCTHSWNNEVYNQYLRGEIEAYDFFNDKMVKREAKK
ncbi:MAG: hypothetical protein FWB90_00730 [Fibromonadales bacterium]|nr:hypothetical protein [Fibromonadales bacterium]